MSQPKPKVEYLDVPGSKQRIRSNTYDSSEFPPTQLDGQERPPYEPADSPEPSEDAEDEDAED